ncbi:uncharacterized protein C8Q71DRAFT_907514 [Rhodofomes roseus]|uniref:Uncharacterized protein n=1 Tax=Rhodofomes roseus TaxID=34475 RepID=A0ABQ8KFS3_9APHY|nr:uncharacterized protein C8Q71DRAFT_907514 [Rhodofomes roseus]KAH9836623.1 hypothetical protein C8Q71DRAFT_907514 [Rhodofomes roseus]
MAFDTLALHLTSSILLSYTVVQRPSAPRKLLMALIIVHVLRMAVELMPVLALLTDVFGALVNFLGRPPCVLILAMAALVPRECSHCRKCAIRIPASRFTKAALGVDYDCLVTGISALSSAVFDKLPVWPSFDAFAFSRPCLLPLPAISTSLSMSKDIGSALIDLVSSPTITVMDLALVPFKGAVTSALVAAESLVSVASSMVEDLALVPSKGAMTSSLVAMESLVSIASSVAQDLALVPSKSTGTSMLVAAESFVSLASVVVGELALVPYKVAVSSTFAATPSLASVASGVVEGLALIPFKGVADTTFSAAHSLAHLALGTIEDVTGLWEPELLDIWSTTTTQWIDTQDGLWLFIQHMHVPKLSWNIGDVPIIGSWAETNCVRLNAVEVGYDSQDILCMLCEIIGYPGYYQAVPLDAFPDIFNDTALPTHWLTNFAHHLWSTSSGRVSVPTVVKASDPRLGLVLGRRPITAQFLARLHRYVSERVEESKTPRANDVASLFPTVKLPSGNKSRVALPLAMSKLIDICASDAGLIVTSVDVPSGTSSDAPLANVIVKLPSANAIEVQEQQRKECRGCPGPREKHESEVDVTPAVTDDKENTPVSAAGSDDDAKKSRRPTRMTSAGMRMVNRAVLNALYHNRRR